MIAPAAKFVDTAFLIALLNPRDRHHDAALAHGHRVVWAVTTHWVLCELLAYFSDSPLRARCGAFVEALQRNRRYEVTPATSEDFRRGLDLYCQRPDKHWSLVDCISFEVMRERGIDEALTADVHFEQAGYRALLRG